MVIVKSCASTAFRLKGAEGMSEKTMSFSRKFCTSASCALSFACHAADHIAFRTYRQSFCAGVVLSDFHTEEDT